MSIPARAARGPLERAFDEVLSGPLPEALARSVIEHRVIERFVAELNRHGELEGMAVSALESEQAERLVKQILESPALEQLVADAVESPGTRRLMTRTLQDPEVRHLLRQAMATQAAGFAEEVVVDVRGRSERLDGRLEGLVWRLLHKHPRTARVPFAGVATRGIGLVVDTLVVHLVFLIGAAIVELVASLSGGVNHPLLGSIIGAGWLLTSVVYFVAFWSTIGQTPGMHVAGVRVRAPDGDAPGVVRSAVRWAGLWLAVALLLAGFVPALIDTRRRALQDFLAGTTVVYAEAEEPLPPAP